MNTLKLLLVLPLLTLSLLACNDKPKDTPKVNEEVYNFRDEKYQDFYSKFMREVERRGNYGITPKGTFERPFDKRYINKVLEMEVKDDIYFKLSIDRIDPNEKKIFLFNSLSERNEVLNFYLKGKTYKKCPIHHQVDGLLCIDYLHYFYIPKDANYKENNIYQPLDFECSEFNSGSCHLFYYGSYPYNIKVFISFTNPNDFFDIIQYVEIYIYQTTGVHLWRHLPREK